MTVHDISHQTTALETSRKKIGLCMIVKDEAEVIERCLSSAKPLVDFILVEDTGSTDGTQDIIRKWLKINNIDGLVYDEPWRNFADNRTHALERLREYSSIGYALVMDADDRIVIEPGFDVKIYKDNLNCDLYDVPIWHGGTKFYRPQLFLNKLNFVFKAVVHEYLEAPSGQLSRGRVAGFHIHTGVGGARSKNPQKYLDDAAILEKALAEETDPFLISRYTFYLAQSYRDSQELEKALPLYIRRTEQGYWKEEIFESLYKAAKIKEQIGCSGDDIIRTYKRAIGVSPSRVEAVHGLSRYLRLKEEYEESFQCASQAIEMELPTDGLFVEAWIYDYGILDEYAVSAYWSGHFREAIDACLKLLGKENLPPSYRKRVEKNARFSLERLLNDQ